MRDIEQANLRVGDKVRVYTNTEPGLVEGTIGTKEHLWFAVTYAADSSAIFYPQWVNRIVLLDRPKPEIPVGTAGTATVRGVKGVRVMRYRAVNVDAWALAVAVDGRRTYPDEDVTDFTPDELLTDETREQIRAEERERIAADVTAIRRTGDRPRSAATDDENAVYDRCPMQLRVAPPKALDALAVWLRGGAR